MTTNAPFLLSPALRVHCGDDRRDELSPYVGRDREMKKGKKKNADNDENVFNVFCDHIDDPAFTSDSPKGGGSDSEPKDVDSAARCAARARCTSACRR